MEDKYIRAGALAEQFRDMAEFADEVQAVALREAHYLAKRAAQAVGSESAVCVWMGPAEKKLPAKVRAEIESEI